MVTNYPHAVTPPDGLTGGEDTERPDERVGDGMFERVRQIFCGMHGHDTMLHFEQDRMFLKCVSCGHESPGWELNEAPPTIRARADQRPQALVPARLMSERRIA